MTIGFIRGGFFKKLIALICVLSLLLPLSACDESTNTSPIEKNELAKLYTRPNDFRGRTFEFTGQVLDFKKDGDTLYINAFRDITSSIDNTIIVYENSDLSLASDDYIKVKGSVVGTCEGGERFWFAINAPQIEASSVEKITATEAIVVEDTFDVNQTITKGACSVTISKVDFTEHETRIFLSIKNNSSGTIDVYADQGTIVQSGKQYEEAQTDIYEEWNSSIEPGATTEGIVAFSKIKKNPFTYSFYGYDANLNDLSFKFKFALN